jgi:hypothetical protein
LIERQRGTGSSVSTDIADSAASDSGAFFTAAAVGLPARLASFGQIRNRIIPHNRARFPMASFGAFRMSINKLGNPSILPIELRWAQSHLLPLRRLKL